MEKPLHFALQLVLIIKILEIRFFTIKNTTLSVLVIVLLAKENQKLSKFLSKQYEKSVYQNKYKTKRERKNTKNKYIFIFQELNSLGINRLFVLDSLNRSNDVKSYKTRSYFLLSSTITNYNFHQIFVDKPIDSFMKRYKEITRLTTGQSEYFTKGCLLNCD